MINTYKKGAAVQLSKHFNSREFDCRCSRDTCTELRIDSELIAALEELRQYCGQIDVNDGYRCEAHNAEVEISAMGHALEHSLHPEGRAADIETPLTPTETCSKAEKVMAFHHGGIGRYKTFVHVDTRGYMARWRG